MEQPVHCRFTLFLLVVIGLIYLIQALPSSQHPLALSGISTHSQVRMHWTPVKVNLEPKDAVLNSDDHFPFDVDGFTQNKMNPVMTTGGLNQDEAWLVTDRRGNGYFEKNILDGEDVFGDHLGRFKNGYEDLADLYKGELQKDTVGKRYIPLHALPLWEKIWIWFLRLFGLDKHWNASYDLMLLTRDHHLMPASSYLSKVYVDSWDVNELDQKQQNWIRQRAKVEYNNGMVVESADQWFQAGFILTPMTEQKKASPGKKH